MMQTYFITANDTDVGKTYIVGLLARHFVAWASRYKLSRRSIAVVRVMRSGRKLLLVQIKLVATPYSATLRRWLLWRRAMPRTTHPLPVRIVVRSPNQNSR